MEIGRKSACSCGVAVLGTGAIDANFHCLGTVEEAEKWRKLKKVKFCADRPVEGKGLNARGVVEYSDFGPIAGFISKTVQDRR